MNDSKEEKNEVEATDELGACQKEREEYLNGWRRAVADFENYKRDEIKRIQDSSVYIKRSIFKELFPILDSLDRAIGAHAKNESVSGLEMVKSQFLKILENNGVNQISANIGDEFDHNRHSALSEAPVEDASLTGRVVEVVSAGYEMDGKVIRAVKVIIGKSQ